MSYGKNYPGIHGMSRSKTYYSWSQMKRRCLPSNQEKFKRYFQRGIVVCDRWKTFTNFLEDMGIRPEGTTLERVDNNKGYEKSNCRWATCLEQSQNRENTVKLTYLGREQSLTMWSRELGISIVTLRYRLRYAHWPVEKVLGTPVDIKHNPFKQGVS